MTATNAAPAAEPEHSAPGGAVHRTGLEPRRDKVHTLRCGCSSTDTRHITFCERQFELLKIHKARVALSRNGAHTHEAADPLLS